MHQIHGSIYCHEIWQRLAYRLLPGHICSPTRYPSFGILIQLLQFYQSYRILEQTLYVHDPDTTNNELFPQEISHVTKRSEPC